VDGRTAGVPEVLTLLVASPRVAPGLMSWPAWQAVSGAATLLASSPDHPVVRGVTAAGFPVGVLPDATGRALLDAAGSEPVVWLASDEEADRLPAEIAAFLVESTTSVEVEVLHASYDVPGARLLDLVTVMDQLRLHCPWDREQTHRSLATYLVEEAYETLEAIETGDTDHLREELGDLLLQVYFHARIAAETPAEDGGFTIDDVAAGIVDKLVHRHPHVFAGLDVSGAEEVEANWETLKAAEKGRASVLEGVPTALPALHLADKVVGKAAKVGVSPSPAAAAGAGSLGDRLLALVVEARAAGADPEQELRDAVRHLADAVRAAESAR
jgi:NTP pyrophosphatase (non-canonical NTP hydrolase)